MLLARGDLCVNRPRGGTPSFPRWRLDLRVYGGYDAVADTEGTQFIGVGGRVCVGREVHFELVCGKDACIDVAREGHASFICD
jgi:hypothetical protein